MTTIVKSVKKLLTPAEPNCLASTLVFTAALVLDAVSAFDVRSGLEYPASLRVTALVLVSTLGSPPIRGGGVFAQRVISGSLLVAVAFAGLHEGALSSRLADATFTFVVLAGGLISSAMGGVEAAHGEDAAKKVSATASPHVFRNSACAQACATLAYCGIRILRQGMLHSEMARHDELFSYSSTSTSVALSFGGSIAAGTAALLFNSKSLREHGTGAKKELITIAFFLLIFSSIFASIASADQISNISAIFSGSACSDKVLCPAATLSRRRAIVSSTSAPLWVTTLGVAVLAYAPSAKVKTWQEEHGLDSAVTGWGALSAALVVILVATHVDFEGSGSHIEFAFVLAIFGISATAFVNSAAGNVTFVIAIGANQFFKLLDSTLMDLLTHLTHCTVFLVVLTLVLRVTLELVLGCWRWMDQYVVDLIDDSIGLLSIVATSLSVLLFLGSAALEATYPGSLLPLGDYGATRDSLDFVLSHYLPCLVCLPIYARAAAVANVSRFWRLVAWTAAPLAPLALWILALLATGSVANHAIWFDQQSLQFAIVAVALAPWLSVALV